MAINTSFEADVLPLVTDLTTAEQLVFSKGIYERAFNQTDITKTHTVLTGVHNGTLIPIFKSTADYGSMGASPTDCSTNVCDISMPLSSFKWSIKEIGCRLSICMRTFGTNFNVFWNTNRLLYPDLPQNSALFDYIKVLVGYKLVGAQWVHAYFGDKSSTNPLLNVIDGFFMQMQAVPSQIVAIAENLGTTYAAQQLSSGQRVYDILVEMRKKSFTQGWGSKLNLEFKMTKQMALAYMFWLNELKDKSCCSGATAYNADGIKADFNTLDNMLFYNTPIKVMNEWDEIIETPALGLNGGGGAAARVNPHRIILTDKDNLLIGTEETEQLSMFDSFYDKKDKKIYIDIGSHIGAGVPLKKEFILAI